MFLALITLAWLDVLMATINWEPTTHVSPVLLAVLSAMAQPQMTARSATPLSTNTSELPLALTTSAPKASILMLLSQTIANLAVLRAMPVKEVRLTALPVRDVSLAPTTMSPTAAAFPFVLWDTMPTSRMETALHVLRAA